jgi:4-hydroxy-4-methyl-2-oxoglutarate aldolase
MADLTGRLERCYTGAVHDIMRAMGLARFTLPHEIRPIFPERTLCGPAFTLSGRVEQGADAHETLLAWTGFLSRAEPGTVVVCQPNDSTVAHMGELSAETLQLRGVRGYVVDGGCRDVNFLLEIGFPVFCRYFTPRDVVSYWLPDAMNDRAVTLGEVTVRPGDYVLGDRDGVVVLPRDRAEEIVARTEEVIATESLVRKAIREGMDPQEAYRRFGKF